VDFGRLVILLSGKYGCSRNYCHPFGNGEMLGKCEKWLLLLYLVEYTEPNIPSIYDISCQPISMPLTGTGSKLVTGGVTIVRTADASVM
jgi:hypothetical protein